MPSIDYVIPEGFECACDFRALLMSLPWIFDTTQETIPNTTPYLFADTKLTEHWKNHVSPSTFNIGIWWETGFQSGSPDSIVRYNASIRSIPLALIKPLTTIPGISFYCMQKTTDATERESITANGIQVFDETFDKDHGAFMDSAALIKHLDLIITIDTALAHLAGGMGAPVWLLLPSTPDWRWMVDRRDTPRYPTMRLFRQEKRGDWEGVLQIIAEELKQLCLHKQKS